MAHSSSAKKRIRQNATRKAINHSRITKVRTYIKKVETAILAGDKTLAQEALKTAQPIIHSSVSKGMLHKNTAGRKLSRLSARIKALG